MKRHGNGWTILSVLAVFAMLALTYSPSFAQGSGPSNFKATPLTPESTIQIAKSAPGTSGAKLTSVIVKLKGAPLATYTGDIQGFAATSPSVIGEAKLNIESAASQAYLAHLAQEQALFIATATRAIPEAKVTYQYDVVLNGVAMIVPADQVGELAKLPSVEAVYPDELQQLQTDNSPQFIGAPTIWNQLGGQESSGDNVVVGVIDTGIWPEHPSFSDPDPSGKAYGPPPPPLSGTRKCQFSGGANPGPAFTCNNKLIGAYRFLSTYSAFNPLVPGEYTSARDDDGHGTHTASTAAGNGSVQASIFGISRGIVSGIAPRARVIAYKALGGAGFGYSSDLAAAVQQAILNGVNVINYSISGGANPYSDAVEQAFLNAYAAGVFVAASAGNAGPAPDTTDHRGPWVTTVAASTQNRAFETTATVVGSGGASLALKGTSITQGITTSLPIVVPATDTICVGPFAPGTFTGKVVVCKRGSNGRADKGYQVFQGGAAGMILYNQSAAVTDVETDNHYLPAIQLQYSQGQDLLTFLAANPGATVTWPQGAKVSAKGDVMASFSSRGGPGQTLGVSKPDITAPGVQILAGASPQHIPSDTALGPEGEWFQAIAGTSMSGPHIAGAGALLKAQHPGWTPGQIKSALMTTAWTQVVKEDGTTPANAFDDGSGRVNLNVAGDPGLIFSASAVDYVTLQDDLWNANYPSVYVPVMPGTITIQRTAHSVLGAASQWTLEAKDKSATDFSVTVPPTLAVPAGGDAPFNIVIDGRDVPLGQVRMATLYLTQDGGSRQLHIPITFVRKDPVVSLAKSCSPATVPQGAATTCTVTAVNNSFSAATVSINDQLPVGQTLVSGSVKGGWPSGNGVTAFRTLAGAQPPAVSIGQGPTPAGYVSLSQFGIAPVSGVTDDSVTNFRVPPFTYAGETYTVIGFGSNGYAVVGGSNGSADVQYLGQHFPDPTRPNNVLAPFWTDFNPPAGGALRIATLTNGVDTWLVLDWDAVKEFSSAKRNSFEIWIGLDGNTTPAGQGISFAYGTIQGNGDGGLLSVGAENKFGSSGANTYYDGTGTLPVNGTELRVTTTPPVAGEKAVVSYAAQADQMGDWVNYAELTSDLFQGTNFASAAGTTVAPAPDVWVKKSGPATAKVGDVVTYTVTLGNSGSAPAIGVVVTDTLFAGATPVLQGNMVLPIVPAGYITTVVQAIPVQPSFAGVTLTNRIEASAVGDIDLSNNQAEAQTVVAPLVAATQTFADAKDTYLAAGQPTTNFGNVAFMYVGANDAMRPVIGFDLSALQPWYPVDKATLSVYIESFSGGGSPSQLQVYQVVTGWAENTATWRTPWSVPGGDYIAASVAGTAIDKTAVGTWKKFDVTPLVQQWVANPAANMGVIMRMVNATSFTMYRLPSRQYWVPANMPKLEVTYRKP